MKARKRAVPHSNAFTAQTGRLQLFQFSRTAPASAAAALDGKALTSVAVLLVTNVEPLNKSATEQVTGCLPSGEDWEKDTGVILLMLHRDRTSSGVDGSRSDVLTQAHEPKSQTSAAIWVLHTNSTPPISIQVVQPRHSHMF